MLMVGFRLSLSMPLGAALGKGTKPEIPVKTGASGGHFVLRSRRRADTWHRVGDLSTCTGLGQNHYAQGQPPPVLEFT